MKIDKILQKAATTNFSDFGIIDWIMLAIGVLRLLQEILSDDGNGGIKLKDE